MVSWIVGAVLSAVAAMVSNLGVNIEKYAFVKNRALPTDQQKPYSRDSLWILGFCIVVFGFICDFIALSMAAQTIVGPIYALSAVANLLFGYFWLLENTSVREIVGALCVLTGVVLAAAVGDHRSKEYAMNDILSLAIENMTFIWYAIGLTLVILSLYVYSRFALPIKIKLDEAYKRYESAEQVQQTDKMHAEYCNILHLNSNYVKYAAFHPFSLCALSGTLGGLSVLFCKMVACLVFTSVYGELQILNWTFMLVLLLLAITLSGQLYFLAEALRFFDVLYLVPIFQLVFTAVTTITGAIFFQECSEFTTEQSLSFGAGLLLTLIGMLLIFFRVTAIRA